MLDSREILANLIAFDTTSKNPNRGLMDYVAKLLEINGIQSRLLPDTTGKKANLFATIGPPKSAGVMLSGHTDVVPVEGQAWTHPPFELTEANGRYYGRGTADMKGFVACAINAALRASKQELKTPLHLAFSYDEEIGCIGVHSLIGMLHRAPVKPAMCIVGEPTSMGVATGHKGKIALSASCTGKEGHSALAPKALNAVHLACDLVSEIRAIQEELKDSGKRDADYDVAYTTLHVGRIHGGVALNIVPNDCAIEFEIRNIAEDDPGKILNRLTSAAQAIVDEARERFPEASITIEEKFSYPGLNTPTDADVVEFVKSLTGANRTFKVAFGTEGGLFSEKLGVPTVICGPGSMAQGHKPDEYVEVAQIAACDRMLDKLINQLTHQRT